MIQNVPAELRALPQWVCFDDAKRPLDPRSGRLASVNDPATWAEFDKAVAACADGRGIGVGFVFTEHDPFMGIDLDVAEGTEPSTGQRRIFETFPTYAERSPSGRGLHIIAKGIVPGGGVRNSKLGVEAYSSGRFFTFTGDVERQAPITDCQNLIDALCAELRSRTEAEAADVVDLSPATGISDEAVREFICGSDANRRHYEGEVSDWSASYFALICAACLVSSDEAQVRRVVLASPLVQRTPPKDGETRSQKAERLWAREYASAAARGAQERHANDQIRRSVTIDTTLPPGFSFNRSSATGNEAQWFSASDFAGKLVPPRVWHVRDLIPTGQPTMFSGDGGTGKSLIAMQLAIATVTGTQWLGLDVREGNALYLSAEDDRNELHRRIAAIGDMRSMHRLTLRSLAGQDALLAAPRDRTGVLARTPLFDDLDARMMAEKPVLLVLDTLADFFGGNENDRAQARQFIGMLRGLSILHECAVLLLSHPSVAGIASGVGTSGSTAWNNSVRSRLYLSRIVNNEGFEPNPDARRLTVKKSNYGRIGKEILVHWHNSVFIAEDRPALIETIAKAEVSFLKILAEFMSQGRRVNASGGQSYAPNVFAAHPESAGITKRAFRGAMEKLLVAGRIVVVETGPASKRRGHLEIKSEAPTLFQPASIPENSPSQGHSSPFPPACHPPSNNAGSNPL
jgi:RecA-family ATPase